MGDITLFPEQASVFARQVDGLFLGLVAVSLLMLICLTVLVAGLAIRYRRGSKAKRGAGAAKGLEFVWIGVLLALFLGIYVLAAPLYVVETSPPAHALEIYGVGKQWMWKFQHPNGRREINTLHVPLGSPVKVVLATEDVIHSFYVPAFRIKQDAVPGRYAVTWFTPAKVGRFHLFCAEYCGLDHAHMGGGVVVMTPAQYEFWLSQAGEEAEPLAVQGEKLFTDYGCISCHGVGSQVHAPSLIGIFGKPVQLQDGSSVTVDDAYLRDSILTPDKQVVAGYVSIMPSLAGRVSEAELVKLIAYIKSLAGKGGT